jgi:hypothetical protein
MKVEGFLFQELLLGKPYLSVRNKNYKKHLHLSLICGNILWQIFLERGEVR